MSFDTWFVVVGLLLAAMALVAPLVRRLPLSTSMLYLAVGMAVSPLGLGLLEVDAAEHGEVMERLAEVAVLVSLFGSGVKTSGSLSRHHWGLPLRLATLSMLLTVAAIAAVGTWVLDLPPGAAILLGAILAPTDPVLASDVQVVDATDRDRLRFALSGEAGLNDGTAFPFVMLGLGLLGLHELGQGGQRWLLVDVAWATAGGLAIGAMVGAAVTRALLAIERDPRAAGSPAEHFAIGTIALAYGLALLAETYGFLAVFAAGFAHRRAALAEARRLTAAAEPAGGPPRDLADDVLHFTDQMERIGEVGIVILVGAWLGSGEIDASRWWFPLLLFLVIRPLAVAVALPGTGHGSARGILVGWFGIRGIGSVYYLLHAINSGLPDALADRLTSLTLGVVTASILLHGISVTPLMEAYSRRLGRRSGAG
ncbi:MAG: cation:proton antiporter [Steroidobacteraceae bacterium]|jgi:NhaP-type Na+/H+ or K+/H+ antiporter|nr:cation:proton antiporter [Steroidobacteraceae bacterium]